MERSDLTPAALESIDRAARAIRDADALLVSAGAGMGVDSGLPDFRGAEGFWRAYPPYRQLNLQFQQLACPETLRVDPEIFWGFYGHRLALYRQTKPHAGFDILRRWAAGKPAQDFVFTSNVDGHFQRAGFPVDRVVECHGSLNFMQCARPCTTAVWPADNVHLDVDPQTMRATNPLPRCPTCGDLARPNILMFGDSAWISDRSDAQERAYRRWLHRAASGSLTIIECGAGISIPTVQLEGDSIARQFMGTLIRINPRDTRVPAGQISLPLPSLTAMRLIDEQISSRGTST